MSTFLKHLRETSPYRVTPTHHVIAAEQIERVATGEIDNLMLLMPVQHGKSFVFSDRIPSFMLGLNPRQHILLPLIFKTGIGLPRIAPDLVRVFVIS